MFLGTVTSTLMIFGLTQSSNLEYPAQSIVRIVKFGFIERFDFFGIATMVFGCVIRISTFQFALCTGIRQCLGVGRKWWIHAIIAIVVFTAASIGIRNDRQYDHYLLTTYYPLTVIISVGIPVLIWIVLEIKSRLAHQS